MSATSIATKNVQVHEKDQAPATNQQAPSEKCQKRGTEDAPKVKKPMFKIGCWNGAFKNTPDF